MSSALSALGPVEPIFSVLNVARLERAHVNHGAEIVVDLHVSEHLVDILLVLFEISIQEQVSDDAVRVIGEQQLIGVTRPLLELSGVVAECRGRWHTAITRRTRIATGRVVR